jgi:hypothetical protein
MKIPNFASLHQAGVGRLSIDSQVGSNFCAEAKGAATHVQTNERECAKHRDLSRDGKTSDIFDHHSAGAAVDHFCCMGSMSAHQRWGRRVRRHRAHVGIEVDTCVLEIREQDVVAQVNRIVADVRPPDLLQDRRPDLGVVTHVVVTSVRGEV